MHSGDCVIDLILKCHRFEKRISHSLGLSVEETHCLSQLHLHAPFSVKQLRLLLGVPPTRMSRLLLSLEKREYITRRSSTDDHRLEQVELTPEGTAVVQKIIEGSGALERELVEVLPSGGRRGTDMDEGPSM